MAQVVVEVNGRSYTMQCNDGEEKHLRGLADALDREVDAIRGAVGQVGDIRLLLMAGLVVSDKLSESERKVKQLLEQNRGLRDARLNAVQHGDDVESLVTERIDAAAKRLEVMAREPVWSAGDAPAGAENTEG